MLQRREGAKAGVSGDPSYPEAGFAELAGDFMKAAKLLAGEYDAGVVREHGSSLDLLLFPFLFLIGHALEPSYKAVLVANGATEKDLKRIGHDLAECRQKVQACYPGLLENLEEPGTDKIVGWIGPYYKAKAFEYHMKVYLRPPIPTNQVAPIAVGTIENIREWVRSSVRQRMQ